MQLAYVAPSTNPWLLKTITDQVQFDCCEHASVALNGTASYIMMTPNGPKNFAWQRGTHNVDNGVGYLPTEEFTRTFSNNFTLCCVIQPFKNRSGEFTYSFEILTKSTVLVKDAVCVHYCTGVKEKQTEMNISANTTINIDITDIVIVVYQTLNT